MKQIGFSIYQLLLFISAVTVLFISVSAFPIKASALELSSQTRQVLPVGGNTCTPVSATGFTPYIYDGALHSFEFTLSDASYVAIIGSVGNTQLPFQLMTRRIDASGAVRIHVDIATTPIIGTLPLQVTLLSARAGSPVCMTTVSMSVGSGAVSSTPSVTAIPQYTPVVAQTVNAPVRATTVAAIAVKAKPPVNTSSATSVGATLTATPIPSVVSTVQNPLRNVCSTETGANRLWLILLVLYALVVGAALWAEFPMSLAWARTPERIATIILALLLLLLGFWYFSISCRAALWMPLLAFLIAVLGLLAAYWNHPRVAQLLLIEEKQAAIITPPPAKK